MLVGRDVARHAGESVLASMLGGRGRLLLVAGEAGIGKTTLVRSIADDAAARGALVRWGACWEGGSLLAFSPWIDALRRPAGDPCSDVAALLIEPAVDGYAVDLAGDARARARLFADTADALRAAAAARPQLVVLEDLHWADASTLELLRAVGPQLPSMAALVVATYRDDELAGGELAGLGGAAEWLHLGGLAEVEVASLLADVLGRPATAAEVRTVHRQTGGNPLFASHVGRLLAAGAEPGVPVGVREVLARRLARLSSDADRVLAAAAVFGASFDVDDVAAVAEVSNDAVLRALDEAGRARLVQPVDGRSDRWGFAHDLVRAARYDALAASERAELHRRIVDVLDRAGTAPAGVLAHHAAHARFDPGDTRAAALAVAAAREALARLAWSEAAVLCERALAVAPSGPDGDLWRAEAWLALGVARLRAGDDDAAASAFGAAADVGRSHCRADVLARAALGFAAGPASFEVPLLQARQIALLEEAADLVDDASPLRPLVLARLSVALSLTGADDRRLQLADDAVRLARRASDEGALGAAIAARCDAVAGPDHVSERVEAASEIIALAQRTGDAALELLGRRHRVVALLELRELAAFEAETVAYARTAERFGDPLYSWYVPLWRAMRALAAGRVDEAEALTQEARSVGESGGSTNASMLARVVELEIAHQRGDVRALDATWTATVAAHPEMGTLPYFQLAAAWVHALADRPELVRPALAGFDADDLVAIPRDQEWLAALAQVVVVAATAGDRTLLQRAYAELLPYAGLGCFEGVAAVDHGVVDRYLAVAAGELGDAVALERHAADAIAAAEASGALVAAATLADCARAFATAGVPDRATALAAESVARYDELGLTHRRAVLEQLASASVAPPQAPPGVAALVRDGDTWACTFEGTTVRIRHAKGVADLAVLLGNPDREIHVRTLEGADGRSSDVAQPVLDDAALTAYRDRLRDLEAELDEADHDADLERAARLAAERDALVEELTRSLGLGGRPRRMGDPDERLRKAVSARVRATIGRLEQLHPALGRHLRRAVRTGYWCSYAPEHPVVWQIERHPSG